MPVALLVFGLLVALLTLPGLLPVRHWAILFPAFVASFLGAGLASWWLVLLPAVTALLVILGALSTWAGWVGLALVALTMLGLAYETLQARKGAREFDGCSRHGSRRDPALAAAPGPCCSRGTCATSRSSARRTFATPRVPVGTTCSTCTAPVCRWRRSAR